MASTLAMGPVITAILALLRASVALTTYVGLRVYPDANGDAPQPPSYPYVQVETDSEMPWNTMGPHSAAKWGSSTRVRIRIGSQSRSDAQGNSIASLINQVLAAATSPTVTGYPKAEFECGHLEQPLKDFAGGVTTREFILPVVAWVHQ